MPRARCSRDHTPSPVGPPSVVNGLTTARPRPRPIFTMSNNAVQFPRAREPRPWSPDRRVVSRREVKRRSRLALIGAMLGGVAFVVKKASRLTLIVAMLGGVPFVATRAMKRYPCQKRWMFSAWKPVSPGLRSRRRLRARSPGPPRGFFFREGARGLLHRADVERGLVRPVPPRAAGRAVGADAPPRS
jgi:hypothetical protein